MKEITSTNMKNILLITGELYPINNGARLHTYGYCKEINKISNLCVFSLIEKSEDKDAAKTALKNDFETCFFCAHEKNDIAEKLSDLFSYLIARSFYLYPVYKSFMDAIIAYIKIHKVDKIIIDHVTMALYYKQLKKQFPHVYYIYNSHNVEFMNVFENRLESYNQHKSLKGKIKKNILLFRCNQFKKHEGFLLKDTSKTFDISENDIQILNNEFHLNNKCVYAKPQVKFDRVKLIDDIKKFNKRLLIVGTMDWWPNIKGIIWFINNVFNKLINIDSEYKLYLVGRRPSEEIKEAVLKYKENIDLVGAVPLTSKYFDLCDISIIPVFEGTGAKLKVLESIARGIPTVCSDFAAKDYGLKEEVMICSDANEFIEAILEFQNSYNSRVEYYNRMENYIGSYYQLNDEIKNIILQ